MTALQGCLSTSKGFRMSTPMMKPGCQCTAEYTCLVELLRLALPVPRVHQAQHEELLALPHLALKAVLRPLQALPIQSPNSLHYLQHLQSMGNFVRCPFWLSKDSCALFGRSPFSFPTASTTSSTCRADSPCASC